LLRKPYTVDELAEAIAAALDNPATRAAGF
jgi:hypothetical protein